MYSELDDKTLVMLTLAGDQSAYEILVTRYQYRVTTAAMSLLHSKFMADDAAQDAFIAAWMKLDTLREPEKFGVWVTRIAKRCALNMRVRYSEYMEHFPAVAESDEDTLDLIYSLPDDALSNPEYRYLRSEERALLRERVDSLPEKVRMIISLHYFDGLSIAEIADRMRISEGTVKRQLHDGRKHLRKELCAMDETMNDSFVRRVMKKVEELKLWQYNKQKNGFESVYRDVLRDVEELPESTDKYHARADVLMRGCAKPPSCARTTRLWRSSSRARMRSSGAMTSSSLCKTSRYHCLKQKVSRSRSAASGTGSGACSSIWAGLTRVSTHSSGRYRFCPSRTPTARSPSRYSNCTSCAKYSAPEQMKTGSRCSRS